MLKYERLFEQLAAVAAVILLVGGCLYILTPVLAALSWAAIISFCTWPLYLRLVRLLRGHRTTAAVLMSLTVLLCVAVPFTYALAAIAAQADDIQSLANKLIERGLPPLPEWVTQLPFAGARIQDFWNGLLHGDPQVSDFLRSKVAAPTGQWLLTLGAAAGAGLLQMLLSIFLTFFFYTGGHTAFDWSMAAVRRVAGERGPRLMQLAGGTVKGVVYGILGTALAQAILAGLAYWIAGVPAAGIWGLATFFLSPVPMGTALIWVPASLWLYTQGSIGWAIFMLLWGALVVSSVDNVIKPLIISKGGGGLPFIIVLLGVAGGALAFGFLGVFIGPTLLAIGYSVLHDWALGQTEDNVTV